MEKKNFLKPLMALGFLFALGLAGCGSSGTPGGGGEGGGGSETVAVTGITLSVAETTLELGATTTWSAVITPAKASNKAFDVAIGDSTVISEANGVITALKEGTSTFTVTTKDGGKTDSATIKVVDSRVPVSFMNGETKVYEGKFKVGAVPALPEDVALPVKATDNDHAYIFRGWLLGDAETIAAPVAVPEEATSVVYNSSFEEADYKVTSAEMKKANDKFVFEVKGEVKKSLTAPVFGIMTKTNDNLAHHGWVETKYFGADLTSSVQDGQFTVSLELPETPFENRHESLIMSFGLAAEGTPALVEIERYHYDANSGRYNGQPVEFSTDAKVEIGNLSAQLYCTAESWEKISIATLNKDIKSAAATSVELAVKEGVAYYVVNGKNEGYSQQELMGGSLSFQHNDNIDHQGWGFYPEAGKTGPGIPAAYVELSQDEETYTMGFAVSSITDGALPSPDSAYTWTIHYAPVALVGEATRQDLKVPVEKTSETYVVGDYVYSIMRHGDTWEIPALRIIGKNVNVMLGATIEADDDGVYYVATGYAGSFTAETLMLGKMLFQRNDNFDKGGWDIITETLAPTKVVVGEDKLFKQYFRVDDIEAAKPTADNTRFVYTTKIKLNGEGDWYEAKVQLDGNITPITRGGFEYTVIQTSSDPQNTWNICSLSVKKLAA